MEKAPRESGDLRAKNVQKLQELFPECVVETRGADGTLKRAVDFEALKAALTDEIADSSEAYRFDWVGKREAYADAFRTTRKTLKPRPEESVDWTTTQNLFIEGDNLDVLKILQESYLGRVNVIYIDPPYNTGSDSFVYADNYAAKVREYDERAGNRDVSGDVLFRENNPANPRFHSDWCSTIYSRLLLARNLLTDDGAIFVSINDVEHANLVKILDEVFGRANYVTTIVWETKKEAKGLPPKSMCVDNHEYIVVYSKSGKFQFVGDLRDVEDGFANPDGDPRGAWKRQYLQRFGQGFREKTIVDPKTGNAFTFETPYAREKLERWIKEGRIVFPKTKENYPAKKEYFSEYENPYKPIVSSWGLFNTKVGSEELKKLFDDQKVFDYSKPIDLMIELVKRAVPKDALVLDFFAGSCSFPHAVMEANAKDGGTRRFIAAQIAEKIQNGRNFRYKNICEIGKERLRRAGDRIRSRSGASKVDVGFRVFTVGESALKEVATTPAKYDKKTLEESISKVKKESSDLDLLFETLLKLGVTISGKYEVERIGIAEIITYEEEIVACFSDYILTVDVETIAKKSPRIAIFNENGFQRSDEKINLEARFKKYSKRNAKIIVI